jgi:hypothetical protein
VETKAGREKRWSWVQQQKKINKSSTESNREPSRFQLKIQIFGFEIIQTFVVTITISLCRSEFLFVGPSTVGEAGVTGRSMARDGGPGGTESARVASSDRSLMEENSLVVVYKVRKVRKQGRVDVG